MKGNKMWYVPSLWCDPVPVTVVWVEKDMHGRVSFIHSTDQTGRWVDDYPTFFVNSKPYRYT